MRRMTAAPVVAGVLLLLGCGSTDGLDLESPTASPSTSPVTTPSTTETVSAEEQAVLDAYYAFYAAVDQAEADPEKSQVYLEPVATGAQFEITNGSIKAGILAGEEGFGTPVLNPEVVSIDGDIAIVHDCQDTSQVGVRRIDTQEPVRIGRNPDSAETTLTRIDGAWKVAATRFPEPPGVYC